VRSSTSLIGVIVRFLYGESVGEAFPFPSPGDLIVEIDRLKQAGYSNVAIGKKLDMNDTHVGGLLALRNAGEERLLSAAIKEKIPLATAIEIARATSVEAQRELLTAYEDGRLSATAIKCVRRLMMQRKTVGKGIHNQNPGPKQPCPTADGMVNAFKKESQRQRSLVRKAKVCESQLMFITTAFRHLAADENFTNLLRAERLDTMPAFLAKKIGAERREP